MFERERTLAYFTEEEIINYCGGRHGKSWRGEGRGGNDVNSAFMQEILNFHKKNERKHAAGRSRKFNTAVPWMV